MVDSETHLPFAYRDFAVRAVTPRSQMLVSQLSDGGAAAFASLLGCELPRTPNRVVRTAAVLAVWMAPGRWLVVDDRPRRTEAAAALTRFLAEGRGAISNVTDGLTVLDLSGEGTAEVLSAATSLDLAVALAAHDHAARTLVAGVKALLYFGNESMSLRLHVEASQAHFVVAWLAEAARLRELGQPPAPAAAVTAGSPSS